MRRPLRTFMTVATLVGTLMLAMIFVAPEPAATQPADLKREAVVLAFFDALNKGNATQAAAAFAGNGFMIGEASQGLCSLAAPCYDRLKIFENMDVLVLTAHLCETVTSLQVTGSFVIGRVEVRHDGIRANGIQRIVQSFMAQVLEDKIVAYFARNDLADPDTARNAAIAAGTQPKATPITGVPPCS